MKMLAYWKTVAGENVLNENIYNIANATKFRSKIEYRILFLKFDIN